MIPGRAAFGVRGTSEMVRRVGERDWAATPVGPVEGWPQSLRATIKTLLGSRYPMILLWGDELVQIYNDAYIGLIGDKHPAALGRSIRETQAESWDVIGPMIREVMTTGEPNWVPAQRLPLERAGYREESYFSLSYSAVDDDDGRIAGMLCVCSEVTQQVLAERRTRLLRDLALETGAGRGVEAACADVTAALARQPLDVPFARLYLREADGGALGALGARGAGRPELDARLAAAIARAADGEAVVCEGLEDLAIAGGPWGEPVRAARVAPIASADHAAGLGVLVAGVSPSRALDEGYAAFHDLLASQVSVALRNARAVDEARRRADALAELDRAKTEFFSNVSHEFRTPLTLMLGPLEDALGDAAAPLPEAQRARVALVRKNALRLARLVNTLLDFSRLEAGRAAASCEPTDLAALTADLASLFRSAAERAGLSLTVDAPPLPEPVHVDRAMWEQIVLNLLSNAVKFTLEGGVAVTLRAEGPCAVLTVRDTGTGIPEAERARVFERFHRVRGAQARTHEGSGIGLALSRELARLHGGDVTVESAPGRGSAFTVRVPFGAGHLAREHVGEGPGAGERGAQPRAIELAPSAAEAFADEAAPLDEAPRRARDPAPDAPAVLLVDDNADLRAYLAGLLAGEFRVEAARDGLDALERARAARPDLVLSDVMMPRLDGFGLLRELRADPALRDVPVVLLSARAGEEATVEGLRAGADDYLIKPFSARELLARVRSRLEIAAMRRRGAEQARELADLEAHQRWTEAVLDALPTPVFFVEPGTGSIRFTNRAARALAGGALVQGATVEAYGSVYRLTDERDVPLPNAAVPAARAARGETVRAAPVVWHTPAGRFSLLVDSAFVPASHGRDAVVVITTRDVTELRAAVLARDEFLSIASHELKTPLTSLQVQLQTLERRAPAIARDDDARGWLERRLETLRRQSRRLARLTDQLLDVSRLGGGDVAPGTALELELEPVDLSETARAVVADFEGDARATCALRVELAPGLVGRWDAAKLEQVIAHLLTNACKFGRGEPVTVATQLVEVGEVDGRAASARLTVRDEGHGIAPADHERIFGRFERAVSSRHFGGLGLGLYAARRLVEALGGTLRVESALGAGATFVVTLPLGGPPAAGYAPAEKPSP